MERGNGKSGIYVAMNILSGRKKKSTLVADDEEVLENIEDNEEKEN